MKNYNIRDPFAGIIATVSAETVEQAAQLARRVYDGVPPTELPSHCWLESEDHERYEVRLDGPCRPL